MRAAFLLALSISTVAQAQPGPTPLIGPGVTAAGCFIQTDFVAGGKHNFELVAQEATNAVHYWRANDTSDTPWRKGDVISTHAIAPGCIVQSDFLSGGHGNLEAVVPEAGGALVHYWHDSGNPRSAWNRTGVVRPSPRNHDARRHGAELLREELSERVSVVHRTHGGT